ncbi:Protein EXORDIUM-like 2 [Raphanus sativus]|uniref:Protein EXORDIUM-like 4 n=1 Tax=Raphanus sativus TaxID=3726 RepID=A0A6J0K3M5_RAPSA|nr:protein EXORDIUM-like 4 [Raphanus sativus]KAJ4883155.1 Protein EXORDIUM-like 2 [Raphanus sativus]
MAYTHRFAILLILLSATVGFSSAALVEEQPLVLKYHNGILLKGNVTLNLVWYGKFTSIQRSIVVDFIRSLSSSAVAAKGPSVASWWKTTEKYKGGSSNIVVGKQLLLENYPLGKSLKNPYLRALSGKLNGGGGVRSITVVITAKDVAVEGFCMNRCGTHGAKARSVNSGAYVWVGNSETQCAGYCAWPFRQPIYGPQSPPLIAPNGDVGVDGMIINLATLLVNTVTNPFKTGYFDAGDQEAVSVCTGKFGSGAYPGYAGRVLVDKTTGASYNALGLAGRKYLLPAMWDPQTSKCKTLV